MQPKFKKVDNQEDLVKLLVKYTSKGAICNPIEDYDKLSLDDQEIDNLIELIEKHSIWVYDMDRSYRKAAKNETAELWRRSSLTLFLRRDNLNDIIDKIKHLNIIIGIQDHISDSSMIYSREQNQLREWRNDDDFLTSFVIRMDNKGNPEISNKSHICNYGSELEELENVFNNEFYWNYFYKNFVEMTIIEKDFNNIINPSQAEQLLVSITKSLK